MIPLFRKNRNALGEIILMVAFLVLTPLTLIVSSISLISISKQTENSEVQTEKEKNYVSNGQILSSAGSFPEIKIEIETADARPEIIRQYLNTNNSPLEPYANLIVETADKYGLDYRLLTSIAQKESGLCRVIPPESHNCWGWGIHSEGSLGFDSYEEAIEIVSKGLKENYIDLGFVTIEQIMSKYAHANSTTWADGVIFYMDQIE